MNTLPPRNQARATPPRITAQTLLLAEVVTQIQLDGIKAQVSQRGQLSLHPAAAHARRCIIQGVRDDHRVAVIRTDEGREVPGMVAHPK